MTDLERIRNSVEIQMELSELLSEKLDMGCWHEWKEDTLTQQKIEFGLYEECVICKQDTGLETNPNLFTHERFLDVFEAVKDRDDFIKKFYVARTFIWPSTVASPHFQLEVALWLNKEDVERILKEGREG